MSKETDAKFLSKKQTKRNLEKYVQSLVQESEWSEVDNSSPEIRSQLCTSRSITNTHSNFDHNLHFNQNVDLNPDVICNLNMQQQCNDFGNQESIHENPDVLDNSEDFHNITSDNITFDLLEESEITEKYYSDSETFPHTNTLQNKLKYWALAHNITLSALDDLLSVLKVFHPDITVSGRSLLHTPRTTKSIDLQNGKFTYFGIRNQLILRLQNEPCSTILNLDLDFNCDGLPLFKSNSYIGVWPILCRSLSLQSLHKPFIVALFTGKGKPEPINLYLQDLIQELDDILHSAIEIGQKVFKLRIRSIICYAPARAFLKCCVSHNAKHGCEKCNIEGEYINHKMIPCTNSQLRTKETFNEQLYEEHHKGVSPLLNLDLDLVNQFPLDSMHLIYLGVMKKLLTLWVLKGKPPFKLPAISINSLSDKLISMSPYIPHEFSRKPRTLLDLNRWKATEFRLFLLYVGPISLINILPKRLYDHFLMLHVGITILSNNNHISKHIDFAEEVLYKFVKYVENSYGKEVMTYNMHSLIHLVADVRTLGNVNTISCFPFENYLGKLKTLVRTSTHPHEQICRRIHELSYFLKIDLPISDLEPRQKHSEGPVLRRKNHLILQYKKLKTQTYVLSIFSPDNCVSIEGNIIIQILNILCLENQSYCLIGCRFLNISEFYNYPCSSKLLNIFKVSCISPRLEEFPFTSVICKNVLLPGYEKETYIAYALLHD